MPPITVNIYQAKGYTTAEAKQGDRTLEITTIHGMRFITASIDRGEYIETVDDSTEDWRPFFIAIHNERVNN